MFSCKWLSSCSLSAVAWDVASSHKCEGPGDSPGHAHDCLVWRLLSQNVTKNWSVVRPHHFSTCRKPLLEDERVFRVFWKGGKKRAKGCWAHVSRELESHTFEAQEAVVFHAQKRGWVPGSSRVSRGGSCNDERGSSFAAEVVVVVQCVSSGLRRCVQSQMRRPRWCTRAWHVIVFCAERCPKTVPKYVERKKECRKRQSERGSLVEQAWRQVV